MTIQITVGNHGNAVFAYKNAKMTAKANRGELGLTWFVGKLINEKWVIVATIDGDLLEVLQRKAVKALLEVLA